MRIAVSGWTKRVTGGALFLWMAVIFAFSSIPGSGSTYESPLWYIAERKGAHIFEFFVLTLLVFFFLRVRFLRESWQLIAWTSCIFAATYGAFDELHQAFVFGRGSHFSDVLIDTGGALLALAFLSMLCRRELAKKRKKVIY